MISSWYGGDGRPTTEEAVACGRGCGGRGVHLTSATRDQDHQHEVRRQGPGGYGKGDNAARPCVCVVAFRYSSEGRAGRVADCYSYNVGKEGNSATFAGSRDSPNVS